MEVIYYQNDNIVRLNSLYDNLTSSYVNDATVQLLRIVDSDGAALTGQNWPVSMAYVAGSDGNYAGAVSNGLSVSPKKKYKAVIDVTAGTTKAKFEPTLLCKRRR